MARPTPAKSMAVITIGWGEYVVPMKDAAQIMQALECAEKYESRGYGSEKMHYIGGEGPKVRFEVISESDYLQGKFAGPYVKDETSE